jgi:hypothetical protein
MGECSSSRPGMLRTAMAEQNHLPRTGIVITIGLITIGVITIGVIMPRSR